MLQPLNRCRRISRTFCTNPKWRSAAAYKPGSSHKRPPPRQPPPKQPPPKPPSDEIPPPPPPKWTFKNISRELWAFAKISLAAAVIGHVVTAHGFSIAPSLGPSMLPTIEVHDWLLTSKLNRRGLDIKVGDVVSFWHPVDGHKVVKRVHGMPGDFVLRDAPGSREEVMLQVPAGHFWAIGDNLAWSKDSRLYGPVPLALIRGRIVARLWPWSWVENNMEVVHVLEK